MRQRHPPPIPQLFRPPLFDPNHKCTSLRNKSRSKPHDTVNYVFARSPYMLYAYHSNPVWYDKNHRGNNCPPYPDLAEEIYGSPVYPEHNNAYLAECLENLHSKDIEIQLDT